MIRFNISVLSKMDAPASQITHNYCNKLWKTKENRILVCLGWEAEQLAQLVDADFRHLRSWRVLRSFDIVDEGNKLSAVFIPSGCLEERDAAKGVMRNLRKVDQSSPADILGPEGHGLFL